MRNQLTVITAALLFMTSSTHAQTETAPAAPVAENPTTPAAAAVPVQTGTDIIGAVLVMRGQLSAKNSSGVTRALTTGSQIFTNEDIITDANSKAQLRLTDDTLISIAESTTFRISNYLYKKTPADVAPKLEIALGTVKLLSGATEHDAKQGIQVLTPEAQVTAEGTMFTATTTPAGSAVGFFRGSGRVTNSSGSIMLGEEGRFDFTILPQGANQTPQGQLQQPGALAALEATGVPGEQIEPVETVSADLLERFALPPVTFTELYDLRRTLLVGGYFADEGMMIPLKDRQVDLHADGINCNCKH